MNESQKRSSGFLRFAHIGKGFFCISAGEGDAHRRNSITKSQVESGLRYVAILASRHGQLVSAENIEFGSGVAVNFHANRMTDFLRKSTPFLRLSFFYFNA
jgi:hypothetical protein